MRFKVALLILLMGTPGLVHAQSFGDLMGQAVRAKNAGNYEKCLEHLEQAFPLATDEDAPTILNNIGRIQELLGQYADAFATYSKVMNDSRTPADMKNVNAARLIAIQGKLNSAWLMGSLEPQSAQFWLAGEPLTLDSDAEAEVEFVKGEGPLEGFDAEQKLASLRFLNLPLGLRSSVHEDLEAGAENGGHLSLADVSRTGAELSINGYTLKSDLASVNKVRLATGHYVLNFSNTTDTTKGLSFDLAAGDEVRLSDLLANHRQEMEAAASAAVAQRQSRSSGSVLPWILVGSGLALGGGGGYFMWKAAEERAKITGEADENNHVATLTRPQADEIKADADTYQMTGNVLVGVGVATVLSGVGYWLFFSGEDAPSTGAQTSFWFIPGATTEVGIGVRF